jgi:ABC-type transport system substrate-binding protein
MIGCTARLALTAPAALLLASLGTSAQGQGTLRVAMTASDVPTTTGAPDNGFEGLRFLGYPVYEGLVLWDLTRADRLAEIRPGLAESWEQDKNDKFHDGNDFQRRRGDLEPRPLFQAGRTAS